MNQSLVKLALLFLVLSLSVFSGYWLRGVLEENKQLSAYLAKAGEAFVLQGQVYEANTKLIQAEEEAKQLRKRRFDKAVVRYVETVGTTKCLSSPEFVQLYNSTVPTANTSK
jgi:hypothetical protein